MKLGIIGLPNVGKSTLFNAITNAGAVCANYPFCTIEPNVGIVPVPDKRLDVLTKLYTAKKTTHATIEFVDIAGLVKGASKGEGLGNKFLSNIREVDAIIHVVRCFDNNDIVHVEGNIDPVRDIEIINTELIFSDIEMLEKRANKAQKLIKADKKYKTEYEFLTSVLEELNKGNTAKMISCTEDEKELLDSINLLTNKPVIYAANLSEDDFTAGVNNNKYLKLVEETAQKEGSQVLPICAGLESDIADMDPVEKEMFLSELNLSESGLDRLIKKGYKLLGLISYLTAGEKEVRAWTITKGMTAPQAAGKIHTDFERGFIRAEVVLYDDLISCGSTAAAKEKGLVRSEGKEYIVKDGDVILFRFNV